MDMDKAFTHVVETAMHIASAVQECPEAASEGKSIGYWLMRRAGSKQLMVDSATANAMEHSQEMFNAVEDVWAVFFQFNKPKQCGQALSRTAYWSLGPVGDLPSVEVLQ